MSGRLTWIGHATVVIEDRTVTGDPTQLSPETRAKLGATPSPTPAPASPEPSR